MKKKHMFKLRKDKVFSISHTLRFGTSAYQSIIKQKFEFVYIRFIKKYLRRRYCKVKMRFFKPKFWLALNPNFIYSSKSKNSRMGAGVGLLVRLVMILLPGCYLLEFRYYSSFYLQKVLKYLNFKCNLKLILQLKSNN